jgi:hypothetical protein
MSKLRILGQPHSVVDALDLPNQSDQFLTALVDAVSKERAIRFLTALVDGRLNEQAHAIQKVSEK